SSNGQGNYQDPYGRPNGGAQQAQGAYQQQSAQNENYYYQQTQEASESAEQSAKPETGNPEQPPTVEVKYCPNCGEPLEHNEKFCPKCGTKQNVTSE
ncbi:MAG: zinc-ribbon domain-containing protein, partial [Oscillospiraceae bacterium]